MKLNEIKITTKQIYGITVGGERVEFEDKEELNLLFNNFKELKELHIVSSKIKKLYCFQNKLTRLTLFCPSLKTLYCSENNLPQLDLSHCPELKELYCYNNKLTRLTLSCPSLERLDCSKNKLTQLDISRCPSLNHLHCSKNKLTQLDISRCPSLNYLHCSENKLTQLDISKCPSLETLYCFQNKLTQLDLSHCPSLDYLYCYNNNLTQLDLSYCPKLNFLSKDDNVKLIGKEKTRLNEESATNTGATFTPGQGEQYMTKYAFKKKKKLKESTVSHLATLKKALENTGIKFEVEGENEIGDLVKLDININKNNLITGDDSRQTIYVRDNKVYIKNFTQKPIDLGLITNPSSITANFKKQFTPMDDKKLKEIIKKELLNEISYRQYKKSTDATPKQKIGNAMKLIKKKINEINKLVDYNVRLKEEMGVGSNDYWKTTQTQIHQIAEELNKLSSKFRNLSN